MRGELIFEDAGFGVDGEFFPLEWFNPAHDTGFYVEALGYINDFLCIFRRNVDFHAVAHIENFVHFSPIGSTLFLNRFK